MNKKLLGGLLSAIMITGVIFSKMPVYAAYEAPEGFIKASATAYCLNGTMYNGEETREGVCASSEDRFGCLIVIYQRLPDGSVGDYIGTYECLDKGGTEAIKKGNVIDIWKPSLSDCQDFMKLLYEDGCRGKVWIQVIKGEG